MPVVTTLIRPIARIWLASVARASLNLSRPTGAPQVHADGADADRILLVADGPSVGHGQLSHELGLAGHLARQLSALTGRGADIDIVAEGNMTAAGCLAALSDVDLSRFDAIVLTIGANEALGLSSLGTWRRRLADLLDHIENSAYGLHTFLIGVPSSTSRIHFPRPPARTHRRPAGRAAQPGDRRGVRSTRERDPVSVRPAALGRREPQLEQVL